MTIALYIRDGATVVRAKTIRRGQQLSTLGSNVEYAIATGRDGEFADWQIFNLLQRLKQNREIQSRKVKV